MTKAAKMKIPEGKPGIGFDAGNVQPGNEPDYPQGHKQLEFGRRLGNGVKGRALPTAATEEMQAVRM